MTRLEEIQKRVEKASEGPWAWQTYGEKTNAFVVGGAVAEDGSPLSGRLDGEDEFVVDPICGLEESTVNYEDADFIAHSREDIPYLLAQVEEPNEIISKMMDALNSLSCSTADFLGKELYRRVARYQGWEDELDEEDGE